MNSLKKYIFILALSIISVSTLCCTSDEKTVQTSKQFSKIGAGFYIFGNKNVTNVLAIFEKIPEINTIQLEFNGKKLVKVEERDGRIEYRDSFENYQKDNHFVLTKSSGKQYKLEIQLEPLDFQVDEPFMVHRSQPKEIPISRIYTGEHPLSLAIFDSYIGVFKTEAEFNKVKNAIIISEKDRERISVGEATILLVDGKNKDLAEFEGNDFWEGTISIEYKSEIKLKVVK